MIDIQSGFLFLNTKIKFTIKFTLKRKAENVTLQIVLRKAFNIFVSSCLAVVLLFGASAKEFVHLFAQHEDTIHHTDHICPPGETHFEQEHHHCAFLHFLLGPFANDAAVSRIDPVIVFNFSVQYADISAKFIPGNIHEIFSRGPPATAV